MLILRDHEVQSGSTRVNWAERLITDSYLRSDRTHDGLASWLMNYGRGEEAKLVRDNGTILRRFEYDERTQSFVSKSAA